MKGKPQASSICVPAGGQAIPMYIEGLKLK